MMTIEEARNLANLFIENDRINKELESRVLVGGDSYTEVLDEAQSLIGGELNDLLQSYRDRKPKLQLKPGDPGFTWPACDTCGSTSLRCGCD